MLERSLNEAIPITNMSYGNKLLTYAFLPLASYLRPSVNHVMRIAMIC